MMPRDFPVDEEVLELLPAGKPKRPETVARPAVADGQRALAHVAAHNGDRGTAGRAQKVGPPLDPGRRRLGRNDAPSLRQPDLSWNRQRILENVRADPRAGFIF